ncbi:zinc finger protein ZAT11-like [Abrus precatorius]|uniref:Zinc finger protein ZAT11-like n=1 Tax=Abrus precatorius TaxID=3816 RepID=A0A8B8L0K8_ABRPR|nr:zinc finger protein ZAT11-like [Abrus precatorius]
MKRQRDMEGLENIDLANCLMLLSRPQEGKKLQQRSFEAVEFECKTCNRKFSSFQALGGHRASHKRLKLEGDEIKAHATSLSLGINKPKMHECSICGQEFSLGQALGGHMRRHRTVINEEFSSIKHVVAQVPVLKRSNSTRAVTCLDLNLTPLENDLKVLFGKMAPNFAGAFV